MEYTTEFIGNRAVVDYLQILLKSGRVDHANLLVGPRHVGKRTLIANFIYVALAQEVTELVGPLPKGRRSIDFKLLQNGTHPNLAWIRPDEKGVIAIETIRLTIHRLHQSSVLPGLRIVVLEDAECLTRSASNALLKELEEPNPNIIFWLITSSPDLIIPTVVSRSAQFFLNQIADSSGSAQGLPGKMIELRNPKHRVMTETCVNAWIEVLQQPTMAARKQLITRHSLVPKTIKREHLAEIVTIMESICRDVMLLQTSSASTVMNDFATDKLIALQAQHTVQQSLDAIHTLDDVNAALLQPIQPQLFIDHLILHVYYDESNS